MKSKHLLSALLAAALIGAPASRVAANDLVGGIVGGIIGGAIVSGANRNKPTKRVYVNRGNTAARAANRETQTALNYFGYPAGTPDGVLGRRSRAAISSMQAFLGSPVTGKLTSFERDILVGAYHRGISGNFETVQLVSKSPDGARALLVAQRDLMTGGTTTRRTVGYAGLPLEVSEAVDEIAESSDPSPEQLLQRSGFIQLADLNGDGNTDYIMDTSFSGSSFWCSAAQCKSIVFVSTSEGYRRNDLLQANPTPANFNCIGGSCTVTNNTVLASTEATIEPTPTETVTASLPSLGTLGTFGTAPVSIAAHCNKVALASGTEGMIVDAAAISDPGKVLDQQFCVARQSAMDDETRMISQLGVTLAQVDAQCAQYGNALKPYVASLPLKGRTAMLSDMAGFVSTAGIDPAQLQTTAKVCLGAGYRLDNAEMAMGTGMLLVQLGEVPYGELMGHHLNAGLGVAARETLAMDWFNASIEALDNGAPAVFAADQFGRTSLIAAALTDLSGGTQTVLTPIVPATSGKAKLGSLGASAKKSK